MNTEEVLIGVDKAAARLDVSRRTITRNFNIVKIGDRALVRVADLNAKIAGGQANAHG